MAVYITMAIVTVICVGNTDIQVDELTKIN